MKEYGPCVISFFGGTFVTINMTDQSQMVTPGSNMRREITIKTSGGPPTLKKCGIRLLRITPMSKNGSANSPMLSLLPTQVFNFICISNFHVEYA